MKILKFVKYTIFNIYEKFIYFYKENSKLSADLRAGYLMNSRIRGVEEAD